MTQAGLHIPTVDTDRLVLRDPARRGYAFEAAQAVLDWWWETSDETIVYRHMRPTQTERTQ